MLGVVAGVLEEEEWMARVRVCSRYKYLASWAFDGPLVHRAPGVLVKQGRLAENRNGEKITILCSHALRPPLLP